MNSGQLKLRVPEQSGGAPLIGILLRLKTASSFVPPLKHDWMQECK